MDYESNLIGKALQNNFWLGMPSKINEKVQFTVIVSHSDVNFPEK